MESSAVNHRQYKRDRPPNAMYDYPTKLKALAIYADTMCLSTAAKDSGIPRSTIAGWLKEEGSDSFLDSLRQAVRSRIAHKLVEASVLAVDAVIDRLQNGDEVLDARTGDVKRVRVKGRDAAAMLSIVVDKHALITGLSGHSKAANDALTAVANKLMKAMSNAAKPPKNEAIEGSKPVDNPK